jgi:glutamate racemase
MLAKNIDQLVLGCTHYPFLIPQIIEIVGEKVNILDSGEAIARQTKVILEQEGLENLANSSVQLEFYTNDHPTVLQNVLNTFKKKLVAQKINF